MLDRSFVSLFLLPYTACKETFLFCSLACALISHGISYGLELRHQEMCMVSLVVLGELAELWIEKTCEFPFDEPLVLVMDWRHVYGIPVFWMRLVRNRGRYIAERDKCHR